MFSFLRTKKTNINAVVALLLKELNVKVSSSTLKNTLEDHPEYPNLLAISDCLTEWRVVNDAYQINQEDYDPEDLLFPFIAHLKPNGGNYILVTEIKNQQVSFGNEVSANATMPEADFLKVWSGVALHATKTDQSGEVAYTNNNIKDIFDKVKLPVLATVIFTGIVLAIDFRAIGLSHALVLLAKLAGVVISILLLTYSIDGNNPLVQGLCNLGKKNSCNIILKSEAAKVTSWLNWSEVGFFYFTGSFLSLLLAPQSIFILAWLNVFALPYSIYSLTYQYKNKSWCVLCCSIQAILWSEFLINCLAPNAFNLTLTSSLSLLPAILFSFMIPISIWAAIKATLLNSTLTKPLKQQLKKFKYNSKLFNQILQNQPKYSIPIDLMPITLGNPDAKTIITMVSNPFCGPCAKAHQTLTNWLAYREDILLKVIITATDDDNSARRQMAIHMNALNLNHNKTMVNNALHNWFENITKDHEKWIKKYPANLTGHEEELLKKQKQWCNMAEITSTPTILLNGYKLPDPYRLEDIKYLLN